MADDSDEEVTLATRGRTVSDMMSGMAIDRESHEIYGKFTQEVLESHFTRFKQYDIDNSGFVSVANLKAIFEALDMPEVSAPTTTPHAPHCSNRESVTSRHCFLGLSGHR